MKLTPIYSLAALAVLTLAPATVHATTAAIPTELARLESMSEDTYDLASSGKFSEVKKNATKIHTAWKSYRGQAARDGASPQLVARMDNAVTALVAAAPRARPGETVKLARIADAVSADMDQFYALYRPTTPTAIMKLDYLGREMVLDGTAGDFAAANRHAQEAGSVWSALKPQILRAKGAKEAKAYEQSLAELQSGLGTRDGTTVVKASNAGLEDLDAMEKLFP
jgi:hypothetical protein